MTANSSRPTWDVDPALAILSLLALAFAAYLGRRAWRRWQDGAPSPMQPIGVIFVGSFFHAFIDFVVQEIASPAGVRR